MNDGWSQKVKTLLQEAIKLNSEIVDYNTTNKTRAKLFYGLNKLLDDTEYSTNNKLKAFQKRLIKHRDKVLTFLYYRDVPPDNNSSERGIRNIKVKQKISGQFVSLQKTMDFAVIKIGI